MIAVTASPFDWLWDMLGWLFDEDPRCVDCTVREQERDGQCHRCWLATLQLPQGSGVQLAPALPRPDHACADTVAR